MEVMSFSGFLRRAKTLVLVREPEQETVEARSNHVGESGWLSGFCTGLGHATALGEWLHLAAGAVLPVPSWIWIRFGQLQVLLSGLKSRRVRGMFGAQSRPSGYFRLGSRFAQAHSFVPGNFPPSTLTMKLSLLTIGLIPGVFAYGDLGHRTVGYVAEKHLSPGAKLLFDHLLANPNNYDYSDAAVWADSQKRRWHWSSPYHYISMCWPFYSKPWRTNANQIPSATIHLQNARSTSQPIAHPRAVS